MVGRVVGSYRIVEKIGEGGMGAVYRAVDEMLEREVAVKAIRPELAREPEIVERFRAEAKILARIHHPAIATIYSFLHDGGELFLAMEFVRGRTLSEVLAAGALPWRRAVALLGTALDGIEQAHRAGIIHRDLKPDNLMLTPADTLKVMDFGIARMPGSSHLTRTGLLIGTLRYVAPEQIRGEEVDRRTDVYALGVVLYQMLTGRVPFDGPTDFLILKAQLEDPPQPPSLVVPEIPAWLDRIVLKALAKAPADRFQTVEELRIYLAGQGSLPLPGGATMDLPTMVLPPRPTAPPASPETIETDRPRLPAAPPPGTSYRPVREAGGRRGILIAVATVLVLGIALTALFLGTRRGPEPAAAPPVHPVPSPVPAASGHAPVQTETTVAAISPAPQPAAPLVSASPPPPAPKRREKESPRPAVSPEPTVAAPAPAQEKAAPAPEPAQDETLPQDLPRLTGELVERSEKLYGLYKDFLGKKEDGGAELTEADNQLKDEMDALAAAADRFNKRVNERFFVRAWDRLKRQDQQEAIRRRSQDIAGAVGRIDRLMAQVQPSSDVRQEWQEVRRRWTRVTQMLANR
ncbi:MAG TPA: protein kinase [Thermoanaerobaculia bacterium]|nr:protein kinase [Thermoanaerobaculia bacterium]